jgi:asparagine synthase (glutamine-hydrolysing)
VPSEQFVNNGCERLLIRRALKDIIPDKIRMNTGKRGIQSADWLQRLKPCWKSIRRELEQLMQSDDELVKKYIELEKVKDELKKTDEVLDENNEETLTRLFTTLIFYRFLINYK